MKNGDSIDGLGLTFGDLSGANAAAVAQFRLTRRIEQRLADIQTGEVRERAMAEFRAVVAEGTRIADLAQSEFDKVGR
jgi:hypothetical protein